MKKSLLILAVLLTVSVGLSAVTLTLNGTVNAETSISLSDTSYAFTDLNTAVTEQEVANLVYSTNTDFTVTVSSTDSLFEFTSTSQPEHTRSFTVTLDSASVSPGDTVSITPAALPATNVNLPITVSYTADPILPAGDYSDDVIFEIVSNT